MGLHNGEQEKTALPGSNGEHRLKGGEQEKTALPGSDGEHRLQEKYNSRARAQAFYNHQVLGYLNPAMQAFIARQEMMFVGTADKHGEADTSFRAGEAGFVRVLDENRLCYPEYRGNGVMASLGNISENPHIGLLFVDFTGAKIGLHVNGRASIVEERRVFAGPIDAGGHSGGHEHNQWPPPGTVGGGVGGGSLHSLLQAHPAHAENHWGNPLGDRRCACQRRRLLQGQGLAAPVRLRSHP